MIKRTFKYCATHIDDERYMQEMCSKGWAALKLVEGFWTFESCEKNRYCYRICYLRGKSKQETEDIKKMYASEGIEFVSRYSFWAIFRSEKEFKLYGDEEEREICRKIYSPMPLGAAISLLISAFGIYLSFKVNPMFLIPAVLFLIYGGICTFLTLSYRKLLKKF